MTPLPKICILLVTFVLSIGAANAEPAVAVDDAWVRATVPTQQATGAFMRLTSPANAKLVGAKSPAAKVVEVHEMAMQNDVMKMRQVPAIDLPAGTPVDLKPGGYHIMLMGLTHQLNAGDKIPVTLIFENTAKQQSDITVQAEVRALSTPSAPAGSHGSMKHQH
nr:copper chaperone PCu(A)C [Achromobacter ruhlandii]